MDPGGSEGVLWKGVIISEMFNLYFDINVKILSNSICPEGFMAPRNPHKIRPWLQAYTAGIWNVWVIYSRVATLGSDKNLPRLQTYHCPGPFVSAQILSSETNVS